MHLLELKSFSNSLRLDLYKGNRISNELQANIDLHDQFCTLSNHTLNVSYMKSFFLWSEVDSFHENKPNIHVPVYSTAIN